ncbi:hypothetical protein D621_15925 [beta proteobacterium AAP51]|nr:hypothetical protein D621_15925 [beta proteobacterium AAP51]
MRDVLAFHNHTLDVALEEIGTGRIWSVQTVQRQSGAARSFDQTEVEISTLVRMLSNRHQLAPLESTSAGDCLDELMAQLGLTH